MKNHEMLVALHETSGVGWKTLDKIRRRFPELKMLFDASEGDLKELGLPDRALQQLIRLTPQDVRKTSERYEFGDIFPISVEHPEYPPQLMEIAQPPWVLYARGRLEQLNQPSIAIVGTRTPTVYGKKIAAELAEGLSRAGVCVISGLARGIDGAAHRGALIGGSGTIAVLGCGIDVIYPREHKPLYQDILEDGLILSEYPPGTPAHPGLFPLRNRIISGISRGTVVVEAAVRSGSLITAEQALEQNRDVFAVPGPVHSPKSMGAHALIRQGAGLITCADDLIEEYRAVWGLETNRKMDREQNSKHLPSLNHEEEELLGLLADGPVPFDELFMKSQTNFGHLHAILLSLQMKKRIEQLPGSIYVLI